MPEQHNSLDQDAFYALITFQHEDEQENNTNTFFPVYVGMVDAAFSIDPTTKVEWYTHPWDSIAQTKTLQNVIARRAEGVILTTVDAGVTAPIINDAIRAGIPVISFGSDSPESDRLSFVGVDNFKAGYQAGEAMLKWVNGDGGLLAVSLPDSMPHETRLKGFQAAIAELAPEMTVHIGYVAPGGEIPTRQENQFERWRDLMVQEIQKYPDVHGIFVTFSGSGPALTAAIATSQRREDIHGLVFDVDTTAIKLVSTHQLRGVIEQDFYMMGYVSMILAYTAHRAPEMPRKHDKQWQIAALTDFLKTHPYIPLDTEQKMERILDEFKGHDSAAGINAGVEVVEKAHVTEIVTSHFETINNSLVDKIEALGEEIRVRKRAEQKLLKLNETLEQRVAERTAEITRQKYVLETFMASVPDSIYFKDMNSRITQANLALTRLLGYNDPDELIGKTDFDLFPEEQACLKYEQEQEIIRTGQMLALEEPAVQGRWALTTKMPLRDEHGNIVGTFGISRDITPLKKAQDALNEAKKIAEAARDEAERAKEKAEEARKQVELQMWETTGQAQLSEKMSGGQKIGALAENVIRQLCEYLNVQVGTLYLMENEELRLRGGYAHKGRKDLTDAVKPGEGWIGQAAAQRSPIIAPDIPQDSMTLISSLGMITFRHLIATPFLYEDEVIGVVELGALHPFTPEKLQFLETAMERIGVAFKTAQTRAQVDILLATTQEQATELQAQSEELRAANEELEAQTQSLQLSEARLRENQAQLEAANLELEEKAAVLQEQQEILDRQNRELQSAQAALEQKAADLARASKYKSEFLANMSHELRTPLNSLLILAGMLQKNTEGNLTEDQVESLAIIHHSGRDLLDLINDILDLSKVEAGRMEFHFEPVSLATILAMMEVQFIHLAQEKGVEFHCHVAEELPPTIISDELRIRQILKNLLSNAFKFTEQGSVSLSITRPLQEQKLAHTALDPAHTVAITVKDTGIGVTPAQQEVIFEAFRQADGGTSRRYGGTGLGLSISREMAFRLGGYIGVESISGQGSAFTLYLPEVGAPQNEESIAQAASSSQSAVIVGRAEAGKTAESPTPKPAAPPSPPDAPAILDDRNDLQPGDRALLIIEDDAKFARIVYNFARSKGFKGLIAGDGAAGIHMATTYQPAAITLDLRLPQIDGWEVLQRLKSDPRTRHIPIHVISVENTNLDAYKQGVLGFLTKPATPEGLAEVFNRIEEFIERQVKSLLIVEDDVNVRRSLEKLLADSEIEVVEAGQGRQALALIKARRFDCIILDLRLPDTSGLDLLRQIHDDDAIPKCPVIVYTSYDLSPEDHAQLRAYADSIIVKEAKSPERLLDETALFLHRVKANLAKAAPQLTEGETALAGKQILVVDDDMRNAYALSKLLREKGITVHLAMNGLHALELLNRGIAAVDLILMDIMMPVMDGFETIRRIRAQSQFKNLPILALTAKAMKGDREKCLDAGANDYLPKPLDPERLFSMLRVWLA